MFTLQAPRAAQEATTLEEVEQTRQLIVTMVQPVGEVVVISLGVGEGVEGVAVVATMAEKEEKLEEYAKLRFLFSDRDHICCFEVLLPSTF